MGFDLNMLVEPKFQDAPGHYRTGGAGIDMLAELMDAAGVLDGDSRPPPPHPDWPEPGNRQDRANDIIQHLEGGTPPAVPATAEELEQCRQFKAVFDAMVQSRSPVPGKVPGYKFGSNEGWLVTPEECSLIAAALERLLADLPDDLAEQIGWEDSVDALIEWIEDWMDYNRVAAAHGGYTVS